MKPLVAAYVAAPPEDPPTEAAVYEGLAGMGIGGLEIPFDGRLHPRDEPWLLGRLRPEWRHVVTVLPGTYVRLRGDAAFGLASADEDGRRRALDFAEEALRAVERLNASAGRRVVAAVEVHSAPRVGDGRGGRGTPEALSRSLAALRRMDWQGAELLLEHCDAPVAGREPDKGFLPLEAELTALRASDGPVPARASINWGRSALETRSAAGVLEHVRAARRAGLLGGLFFSGATPSHPEYGEWRDSHAPFSTSCPASLLTPEAAVETRREAGPVDYLGVKVKPRPAALGVEARLAVLADALRGLGPA